MFSPMRLSDSTCLAYTLGIGLFAGILLTLGVSSALAQHVGDGGTAPHRQGVHIVQDGPGGVPPTLRRRLSEETLQQLRKRRSTRKRGPTVRPKSHLSRIEPEQSWIPNENPTPSLNFGLTGTPQFAGDVNGDGTNDYLYADGLARDERTPEVLEDRTGKTALFYGGTPSQSEDQLLYQELRPAGDLNNDGRADAIEFEDGSIRFWAGSSGGYDDTGTTISNPFGSGDTVGFTDLDGDGFEDVLVFQSGFGGEQFAVIYGSNSFSGADVQTYVDDVGSVSNFAYNVAELDGDGSGSVVRLAGGSPNMLVQVFGIEGDRSLIVRQTFQPEELENGADRNQLSLIDITGNDTLEIAAKYTLGSATYVFEQDSDTGAYIETPTSFGKDAVPVGDLDGDGRHDFYTVDDAGTRYISYGPMDLSQGLSFDTEVPYAEGIAGSAGFIPQGGLGDVTGDERPDVGLGLSDYSDRTVGRRFFSVDSDRTGRSPADVSYPQEHFFDSINETNEIGDFNDDGTTDLAMVRSDLGRVEVFYGGDPISQEPDLTITPPADSLFARTVSSGDFDGDGVSDLLIGYGVEGRGFDALRNDIYLGGSSPDATSDHTVLGSDVGFPVHAPRAIGDVNGDGATDWMTSDRGFNSNFDATGQNVAIFFGSSSLPTTPDQTLQYPDGMFLGEVSAALGDVNGDGIDDFAFQNPLGGDSQVHVHYGGTDPSFTTSPDLALPISGYSDITGGDFNGDGESDVAAVPFFSQDEEGIRIFHGGPDIDSAPDKLLSIPAAAAGGSGDFDGDGLVEQTIGVLESPGDVDGNGTDELIHGSSFIGFATNALLYRPSASTSPIKVFRAPNQDAPLGGQQFAYSAAMGDFTGNGTPDFVAPQFNDNNDAARSSRIYRYSVSPDALPPAAPTGFQASRADQNSALLLEWNPIEADDLDGYNVYRSTTSFAVTGAATKVNTQPLSETQLTDGGLMEGTTYHYRVTAVDTSGTESGLSAEVQETTAGLVASDTSTVDTDEDVTFENTSTSLDFSGVTGSGSVTVNRYAGEPDGTDGITENNVSDDRLTIEAESGFGFDSTKVRLAVSSIAGVDDPGNVTIYKRDEVGTGTFSMLTTAVDDNGTPDTIADDTLEATTESFSEFALASDSEPLPVELSGFEAEVDNETVRLTWQTVSETGNAGFGVQRKAGQSDWEQVGFVESKASGGTTTEARSYRFTDRSLPYEAERLEYRLRQVDTDGSTSYSDLVTVERTVDEMELLGTYPNPAQSRVTVRYAVPEPQDISVRLYDVLGRRVRTVIHGEQSGRHKRQVDLSGLASGVYFLRLSAEGQTRTRKLTVVR